MKVTSHACWRMCYEDRHGGERGRRQQTLNWLNPSLRLLFSKELCLGGPLQYTNTSTLVALSLMLLIPYHSCIAVCRQEIMKWMILLLLCVCLAAWEKGAICADTNTTQAVQTLLWGKHLRVKAIVPNAPFVLNGTTQSGNAQATDVVPNSRIRDQ